MPGQFEFPVFFDRTFFRASKEWIVIAFRNSVVVELIVVGAASSREQEVVESYPGGVAGRVLMFVEWKNAVNDQGPRE